MGNTGYAPDPGRTCQHLMDNTHPTRWTPRWARAVYLCVMGNTDRPILATNLVATYSQMASLLRWASVNLTYPLAAFQHYLIWLKQNANEREWVSTLFHFLSILTIFQDIVGIKYQIVKHSEEFPGVWGGNFISVNIPLEKRSQILCLLFKWGIHVMPTCRYHKVPPRLGQWA